ncbi:hypothetical protein BVX97_05685 [bacterium E08(2017)]|nr:hypothetical protein BVX97_05685 [bacterium E08(2017)]
MNAVRQILMVFMLLSAVCAQAVYAYDTVFTGGSSDALTNETFWSAGLPTNGTEGVVSNGATWISGMTGYYVDIQGGSVYAGNGGTINGGVWLINGGTLGTSNFKDVTLNGSLVVTQNVGTFNADRVQFDLVDYVLNGGTLSYHDFFQFKNGSTLTMNGGTLNGSGANEFGSRGSTGTAYLNGGAATCGTLGFGNSGFSIVFGGSSTGSLTAADFGGWDHTDPEIRLDFLGGTKMSLIMTDMTNDLTFAPGTNWAEALWESGKLKLNGQTSADYGMDWAEATASSPLEGVSSGMYFVVEGSTNLSLAQNNYFIGGGNINLWAASNWTAGLPTNPGSYGFLSITSTVQDVIMTNFYVIQDRDGRAQMNGFPHTSLKLSGGEWVFSNGTFNIRGISTSGGNSFKVRGGTFTAAGGGSWDSSISDSTFLIEDGGWYQSADFNVKSATWTISNGWASFKSFQDTFGSGANTINFNGGSVTCNTVRGDTKLEYNYGGTDAGTFLAQNWSNNDDELNINFYSNTWMTMSITNTANDPLVIPAGVTNTGIPWAQCLWTNNQLKFDGQTSADLSKTWEQATNIGGLDGIFHFVHDGTNLSLRRGDTNYFTGTSGELVGQAANWSWGVLPTPERGAGYIYAGASGDIGGAASGSNLQITNLVVIQEGGNIQNASESGGAKMWNCDWTLNGGSMGGKGYSLYNSTLIINTNGTINHNGARTIYADENSSITVNGGTLGYNDEHQIGGGTFVVNSGIVRADKYRGNFMTINGGTNTYEEWFGHSGYTPTDMKVQVNGGVLTAPKIVFQRDGDILTLAGTNTGSVTFDDWGNDLYRDNYPTGNDRTDDKKVDIDFRSNTLITLTMTAPRALDFTDNNPNVYDPVYASNEWPNALWDTGRLAFHGQYSNDLSLSWAEVTTPASLGDNGEFYFSFDGQTLSLARTAGGSIFSIW